MGRCALRALCWMKKYLFTFSQDLKKKYGDGWVLITGASDGIGKSLAKEFVSRGHKVLLVARNEDKLKDVVKEFKTNYSDAIDSYIVYDFNRDYNEKDIQLLKDSLAPYDDIAILINNVGVSQGDILDEMANDQIRMSINVNITSVTVLTKLVLEKMKDRKNRSLIASSGSGQYILRSAFRSVYCATKCYVDGFMDALQMEYENIDFCYMEIGSIKSNMNSGKNYPCTLDNSDVFASAVVKHFGKYSYSAGYWKHGFVMDLIKNSCFLRSVFRKRTKQRMIASKKEGKGAN